MASSITANVLAQNLITDGEDQYCVLITDAGRVRVGWRQLPDGVWRFNTIGSTMLGQPVADDEHCYPTIGIDDDGFLFVLANMHVGPLRMVRSKLPRRTDAGWKAVSLPAAFSRNTYPLLARLADGTLWLHLRAGEKGGPGRSDSYVWLRRDGQWSGPTKLFKGVNVAGGSGPEIDDSTNYSAYPMRPHVDNYGTTMHLAWCWRTWGDDASMRTGDASRSNFGLSYARSHNGLSWYTIDGTPLKLPIDPIHDTASQTLELPSFVNGGGITVGDDDDVHLVVSRAPYWHVWHDNGWRTEQLPDPAGPVNWTGFLTPHWYDGKLWLLGTEGAERRLVLARPDGSDVTELGRPGQDWSTHADPEQARRGRIEVLLPDGDLPATVAAPTTASIA
jgi:hypothetical protein